MTKYVIMNKPNGRYYVSSASSSVDHFDPNYAKVFPTMRSARAAFQWFDQAFLDTSDRDPANWIMEPWDPAIFEATITVSVGKEVEK